MERYERIVAISGELAQEDCPIIFEKGALLKDNKIGKNVLQLQFKNIGTCEIKAVYVWVNCFDIEKNLIDKQKVTYLDLKTSYNESFGSNKAIELQCELAREFQFSVEKVIFSQGNVIECAGKMCWLQYANVLEKLEDLKDQFIREVNGKIHSYIKCRFMPTEYDSLWWCTCGALNYKENEKCGSCGSPKDKLFDVLDADYLKAQLSEFLKNKEIEEAHKREQEEKRLEELRKEEERKQEIRQIKKQKNKKRTRIAVAVMLVIVAIYGVIVTFAVPAIKYSSALKAINNNDFEEGYKILTELGDYKDSKEQIKAGKYKQALKCIDDGEYKAGYRIFSELGDYSDSREQVKEGKYKQAADFFEKKEYMNAIRTYVEIKGYKDSEDKIKETRYQYAKESIELREYKVALDQLEILENYKDSKELYQESCYGYAQQCVKDKKIKSAVEYYEKIIGFSDSKEKWLEAMEMYIKGHLLATDQTSIKYVEKLIDNNYAGASKLKEQLYELRASIIVNGSRDNLVTNSSKLSKYDKWYFHVTLDNGNNDKRYKIKYTIVFPDGGKKSSTVSDVEVGAGFTSCGWYENPQYGESGTATIKVYSESGKLLAEKSVEIN